MTRQFGRLTSVRDERDKLFRMDVPHPARRLPASRSWQMRHPVLDQEDRPQCVAYAWTAMLLTTPISSSSFLKNWSTKEWCNNLYTQAQRVDGIHGSHDGTTVRAGASTLKALGFIVNYLWGVDADTVRRYVLSRGPVVIGVDWKSGMMEPDPNGYVRVSGASLGGHAVTIVGYSSVRAAFRVLNSWGSSWGTKGRCWVPFKGMDTLLSEDGEACSAIEAPVRPVL